MNNVVNPLMELPDIIRLLNIAAQTLHPFIHNIFGKKVAEILATNYVGYSLTHGTVLSCRVSQTFIPAWQVLYSSYLDIRAVGLVLNNQEIFETAKSIFSNWSNAYCDNDSYLVLFELPTGVDEECYLNDVRTTLINNIQDMSYHIITVYSSEMMDFLNDLLQDSIAAEYEY